MNETGRSDIVSTILQNTPILISTLSLTGLILAFAYETGYAWHLGIKLHLLLDLSDLIKTSTFTIPFVAGSVLIGAAMRLLEGVNEGKFSWENLPEETTSERWSIRALFLIAFLDFLHFILLGGSGGFRLWVTALVLWGALKLTSALRKKFLLSTALSASVFLALFIIGSIIPNASQNAYSAINRSKDGGATYLLKDDESLRVIRRLSSGLVVFDGKETLSLLDTSHNELFRWTYREPGWRGVLCDSPPATSFGSWSKKRCNSLGYFDD